MIVKVVSAVSVPFFGGNTEKAVAGSGVPTIAAVRSPCVQHNLIFTKGQKELFGMYGHGTAATLHIFQEALNGPDITLLTRTQVYHVIKMKAAQERA